MLTKNTTGTTAIFLLLAGCTSNGSSSFFDAPSVPGYPPQAVYGEPDPAIDYFAGLALRLKEIEPELEAFLKVSLKKMARKTILKN